LRSKQRRMRWGAEEVGEDAEVEEEEEEDIR